MYSLSYIANHYAFFHSNFCRHSTSKEVRIWFTHNSGLAVGRILQSLHKTTGTQSQSFLLALIIFADMNGNQGAGRI